MSSRRLAARRSARLGLALAALVAVGAAAAPAGAQDGGKGFLFREPIVTFGVRGGLAVAQAGGELFSQTTQLLTVDRRDFSSSTIAGDLGFRVSPRLEIAVGGGLASARAPSEFRRWLDNDDRPVRQTTDFQRVPLTVSAKLYLAPRGRSIGQFAWVPARLAPYVGAGAGNMWYRFRQVGDFVDNPFDVSGEHRIFADRFESSGWTPTAHAMAGLDLTLTNHVGLTTEARYGYAKARLGSDFQGFDRIDLSGATATVGLFFRF